MSQKTEIIVNDKEARRLYSNLISINVSPEEVCLGFGVIDIKDSKKVNVDSYVYLSIPHFIRFADAVNKNMEMLIDKGVITKEMEQ
jgi:hypothetical protein